MCVLTTLWLAFVQACLSLYNDHQYSYLHGVMWDKCYFGQAHVCTLLQRHLFGVVHSVLQDDTGSRIGGGVSKKLWPSGILCDVSSLRLVQTMSAVFLVKCRRA